MTSNASVIIGADEHGRKELLAIADGYRESAQSWRELSWRELLLDLKRRGLGVAPELAVGDGAHRLPRSASPCCRSRRGERPSALPLQGSSPAGSGPGRARIRGIRSSRAV